MPAAKEENNTMRDNVMMSRSRKKAAAVLGAFTLGILSVLSPCTAQAENLTDTAENNSQITTETESGQTGPAEVLPEAEPDNSAESGQTDPDVLPGTGEETLPSGEEPLPGADQEVTGASGEAVQEESVPEEAAEGLPEDTEESEQTAKDAAPEEAAEPEEEGEPLDPAEISEEAEVLDATATYVVDITTASGSYFTYSEYATGKEGYISGTYCADAAYLGTSGDNYIFMVSGVIGKVNKSKVSLRATSTVKSLSHYFVSGGTIYHRITKNLSGSSYVSSLDNGKAPSYLSEGKNYYSYDGHYFYTSYSAMIADYVGDTRSHSVNPGTPFFNYFQFLPLRSGTVYTAAQMNQTINSKLSSTSVMKNIGNVMVPYQNTYGVNALLASGVAIVESGWGNSTISREKHNLFGLNAVDASPGQSANYYSSPAASVKDFMETYMSRQYLNPSSWKYSGGYLGNKAGGINLQYSSDPYWGEKAANIAYYLEDSLSQKDSGRYTIAVKDPAAKLRTSPVSSLAVKKSASASSGKLYNAAASFGASFILKDASAASGGFYRVQSDPVLNSGRTAINNSTGAYSFSNMYGYVPVSSVTMAVQGSGAADPVQTAQTQIKNGVCKAEDGNWYYYQNGVINTQYTGIAQNSNGWWRIENGKVNFHFNGFAKNSNGWWYLAGGKVQFGMNSVLQGTVNGVSGWWYVVKGKVTFTTTVAQNSNGWWRIENGKVNFNYKGFAQNSNGWWYLEGGKVQFETNDIIQGTVNGSSGWWYIVKGKVTFAATVAKNKYGWWRVENGKVNFDFQGLAQNSNGWWKIADGKVDFSFHGFVQNQYGWWYVDKGKVQFDVSSVIQGTVNGVSGWWYVADGKVSFTNTLAKNQYGWWRIENGRVNFSYQGFAENQYGWWYLTGGKVQFEANGVFEGTVRQEKALWYVVNGKVDFSFDGTATFNKVKYRIVKGKAEKL